jgi:hypothetical protein
MDALDLITRQFPGKLFIPLTDAAIAIGYKKQTAYNLHSKGKFPIRVQKRGTNSVVSIMDLAAYLNLTDALAVPPKRRPGRPTKAEQIARRGLKLAP